MQPLLARHVVWNSKKFQLPVKTENVAHWPAPGCSWSKTFHSFNFYNNCNPNQPSAAPWFCFKLQLSDPDLIVSLQENRNLTWASNIHSNSRKNLIDSIYEKEISISEEKNSPDLHLWRTEGLRQVLTDLTSTPPIEGEWWSNVRFNQWPLCQWQCLSLIVWKKWYWWQWL